LCYSWCAIVNSISIVTSDCQVSRLTGDLIGDEDADEDVENLVANLTMDAGAGGDDEEEDVEEFVSMSESSYYMEHILRILAICHSLAGFSMLVAYYCLKVPLVIFKREKEIARKLEFDGLWIAEQPSEDDLKSQWDKLVLSTASFPDSYWDKFVKKKVGGG